jgi:NADPH2:quinone reductase
VSGPEKAELARASGADLVVDYTADDALDQLRSFAPRMDRIIEVNIGANLGMDLQLSGPESTIVCYAASGPDPMLPVRACMSANVTIRFVLLYGVPREALLEAVGGVNTALEAGFLTPLPVHRFPLEDVAAAHEAQEANVTGKVLLDIA